MSAMLMHTPSDQEMARIHYVDPAEIDAFWETLRPHVADSLKYDPGVNAEDVRARIKTGQALALVVADDSGIRASCVVQRQDAPQRTTLLVISLGGSEFNAWAHILHEALERMAADIGAPAIEALCRPGMARWLKRFGWRHMGCRMEWQQWAD